MVERKRRKITPASAEVNYYLFTTICLPNFAVPLLLESSQSDLAREQGDCLHFKFVKGGIILQ
jgi:hypothetical protein